MPFARNGNVDLYYDTFGDPGQPAMALINGLGSQCINYRDEWCERWVSAGFFTIRFDNRDVGLSTHFHDYNLDMAAVAAQVAARVNPGLPYSLSDMAADAVAVLDAVGVDRAHVCGLSMGGMIVQTLAIEHPDRLLSATSVMSRTGEPEYGHSSPEAGALLFGTPPTDQAGYEQRQVDGLRVWGSPAHFDEATIRANAAEAFRRCFDPAGQARQAACVLASGSRAEALRHVKVPFLVIHGDADTLIDISGGRRTAELVPGARLEVFEGMGHDYPPAFWDRWISVVSEHAGLARA